MAEYYVRADGTAASKETATSGSDASTAMSVATHNAQTYSPGDVIILCSDGGDFTATIIPPSSGSAGLPITYRPDTGQTVTVDATGKTRAFYVNAKSDIKIQGPGLIVKNSNTANIGTAGITGRLIVDGVESQGGVSSIYILAGANVEVKNNIIRQGTQYGLALVISVATTVTDGIVSGNTFIGTPGMTHTAGIYLRGSGLTFSNNSITNWSLSGATSQTINCVSLIGMAASGNTISNATGHGYSFDANSNGNTITGDSLSTGTGTGIKNIGGDLTLENVTITGFAASGLSATGTGVNTLTECALHTNTGVGASFGSGASAVIVGGNYHDNTTYGIAQTTGSTGDLSISGAEIYNNGGTGVTSVTSGDVTVNQSDMHGNCKTTAGANLLVGGSGTATITNSNFYEAAIANTDANASDGVKIGGTVVAIITRCSSYRNKDDGYQGNEDSTSTYTNCTAYENGSTNQASGDGWTGHENGVIHLRYCAAWGNWKSGVAFTNATSGSVYNCTFYNNYNTSNDPGGESPWYKNQGIGIDATGAWDIRNNIAANNGSEIVVTTDAMTGRADNTLTIDYNIYHDSRGGDGFYFNGTSLGWAGWLAALSASSTVVGKDAHSANSDPLFVDPSTGNFRLQSTSPAIDAGVTP